MSKQITVKIQESFYIMHQWKDCLIEEVMFLRNKHIHKMFVEVEVEVMHSDRDVEFFLLRTSVIDCINYMFKKSQIHIYDIEQRSMEMVAEELFDLLKIQGYNVVCVECSEDNIQSGKVTKAKEE